MAKIFVKGIKMVKTGGEIIVDYLIKKGIEYVIGIPGHGCLAFFDALRDRASKGLIKYIQVKQEMSAVHMADGYYRATGKPLVVFASIGPGSLNTITGVGTSFVDSTPVLVLIGDAHIHMRGMGILQEIERKHDSDILSCFKPITKRCWRVENVIQLPKIIKRAYHIMMSDRKGPVVISMPMDIQAESYEYEETDTDEIFSDYPIQSNEQEINKAFMTMKEAKRPVILAGGGLLYSRVFNELKEMAEIWGAAVVTTMAGKSCFPEDHPLYGWHGGSKGTDVGNYLCRTADVILSLGCRFADETTSSYRKGITFSIPDTKLIQVDIDRLEIGKNYPVDVGIVGDIGVTLSQLIKKFKENCFRIDYMKTAYFEDIKKVKDLWYKRLETIKNSAKPGLTISRLLFELNRVLPEETIIVTSSGNTQAQILQEYCFKVPGTHITTGGFSTMGFALPAAIGAKLAKPDVPVVAIMGDGDFYMTMQELSTAVQYDMKILVIMVNNYGWMAIRDLQLDMFGNGYDFGNDFVLSDGSIYSPDFVTIADSFGFYSQKITQQNEVEEAVRNALSTFSPSFIEVIVERDYPFSGGIATGWWDVPVPYYIRNKDMEYRKSKKEEYIK
jgi:acetolactate synthase-1/2/3 large subunit